MQAAVDTRRPNDPVVPIWVEEFEPIRTLKGDGWPIQWTTNYDPTSSARVGLHSTEGDSREDLTDEVYAGHRYPPAVWDDLDDSRPPLQGLPLNYVSYALEHPEGTPETNGMGVVNPQVEIEARAANTGGWSEAKLRRLGEKILAPIWRDLVRAKKAPPVPLVPYHPTGFDVNGGYGTKAKSRMSDIEWRTGKKLDGGYWNVYVHANVPWNNHWDMGPLNLQRACDWANRLLMIWGVIPDMEGNLEMPVDYRGSLDKVDVDEPGVVKITGWVADATNPNKVIDNVQLYVDGKFNRTISAGLNRDYIKSAGFGTKHVFYETIELPAGSHRIDLDVGGSWPLPGAGQVVTVKPKATTTPTPKPTQPETDHDLLVEEAEALNKRMTYLIKELTKVQVRMTELAEDLKD